MKSARLIGLALVAFFVVAVLLVLLSFSPLNPFAPRKVAQNATPTREAQGTPAAPSAAATSSAEQQAPVGDETAEPPGTVVIPTPQAPLPDFPVPTIPANAPDAFQQALTYRRNGDYVRAATAFRTTVQESSDPALARQAQFRLGEALYLAADFTNAVPALQAVIDQADDDDLAARAHYFLGDIFTQQQKYDDALAQLRIYRERTRALQGVVDRELGDVLLAAGDSAAAVTQYDAALQDPTFTNAQRVAVLTKIAEVLDARGEATSAAERLAQAFELAPDNPTRANVEYLWGEQLYRAGKAQEAYEHWRHALAAYTETAGAHRAVARLVELDAPNINELQRGIANYAVGSYDLALQAFRRYIAAQDTPGALVLYYAALAYQRQGNQAGALRNLAALLESYPDDPRVPDALYAQAVSQTRQGDSAAALATLHRLLKAYPNDARIDNGFWNVALYLEGAERHAEAADVYVELADRLPASSLAAPARFNAGVQAYLAQDYARAREQWNRAIQAYPNSQYADSAAYWLGKLTREQGDPQTATQFYQQATKPPRTYYSWRAFDALNQGAPPPSYRLADYAMDDTPQTRAELAQWVSRWSGAPASAELPAAVKNAPAFRRGSEYASLARALDARPQFQAVNETFAKDPAALLALALYYKDNNYFSLSIDAASRLAALSEQSDADQPRLLRQLVYPTYFADLIVPYAETHKFDPALFFGLVRQESSFNPMSYSSAQARGLSQVIPATGQGIARALSVQDFQQDDLFKPYVSVRFGTYYLGSVLDSFDGNIFYALMGYNGGPGNARRWEKPDLDAAVESITYAETHLYVRTVYDQYREYVDVYRGRENQ